MDTAQWPQEILVKPVEEIITNTTTTTTNNSSCAPKPSSLASPHVEKKAARPQKEQALNCPRCNSTNTKFCYYNNYSLSQPRYFCKTCRRYWTAGGSLRNIPVGGGSRKNRRPSSSSSSLYNSNNLPDLIHQNPSKIHGGQDLNLSFPSTAQGISSFSELIQAPETSMLNGMSSRGLMSSLISLPIDNQDPNTTYSSGFLQDFKITGSSSLNFSLDGLGSSNENDHGYGNNVQGVQEISTDQRQQLLFPFQDLKQPNNASTYPTTTEENRDQHQQHGESISGGYWTGMLGGGSW